MGNSTGQLRTDEGQEPTLTPAIPVEVPNIKTNVIRLLVNGFQNRKLHKLANTSAKLWNELTYERRQQYFKEKKVNFKETYKKYYEKYKIILKVNAQAIIQKNNEAWSSFFSLLKQGEKATPPGYWKSDGKRKEILIIRQDRYEVRENKIILRDFAMEVEFAGKLNWSGKQGRLEIIYDEVKNTWYANIPVEVGVYVARTGKPSKYIVKGKRDKIIIATPKSNKKASIDLGINMLASVVVDDGTWLLYRGTRAKEDYFYFQKKIAEVQSLADKTKNIGEAEAYEELNREKRRLFKKLYSRLLHLYRTLASHLARTLYELGVSEVYVGYPYDIAQDKGNKFTVNMWSYGKLIDILSQKLIEYGMRVYKVIEYNTSRYCAYHGVEVVRKPRGTITCSLGHKLHSDLNGALNIMKRVVKGIPAKIKRPLSFYVFHNGVAPIKGSNALDPSGILAFRAWSGSKI
ncbi:RNA-guided endonuclease InsQ/TnpB family protein [Acidianus manzaensis]|uniref:Transposase n=1 Tax=Acidianus manzaensis TaxID=282676 RepID=A0A1W6JYT6_9CREN|nr:RNA-guided endonuclease TnpB family protein [Acidianus manzaensis]ARM75402.1 transposase [Acidianus manzaensis]